MSVNKSVRAAHCNVRIYTNSIQVATIYQLDGLLSVKDVTHDLELCLLFDRPDDDAGLWQPALLAKDGNIIILDQQDSSEFPTPPNNETVKYNYIYHSTFGCTRQELHRLQDTCIKIAKLPKARRDPRYIAVGKTSSDERFQRFPTRALSLKRRSISSRTSSPSPTRTDYPDVEIPPIIDPPLARAAMKSFREDVWKQSGYGCAVTRRGNLSGSPAPGIEAAHIVPQSHWMVFPMNDQQDVADPENDTDLGFAWKGIWSANTNGIMLESTLYKCFNARLFSIHPVSRKIRVFVNSDILIPYHGQIITLSGDIPEKILWHHYHMTILENVTAPDVPPPPRVLTDIPELPPRAKVLKASEGDPSKQPTNLGTPPSGAPSSGGVLSSLPPYDATAHPPSSPPSEPGSEERMSWPFGKEIIESPGAAQPLVGDTGDHEEHGRSRGRSRVTKRCIATRENGENEKKRQRLE